MLEMIQSDCRVNDIDSDDFLLNYPVYAVAHITTTRLQDDHFSRVNIKL